MVKKIGRVYLCLKHMQEGNMMNIITNITQMQLLDLYIMKYTKRTLFNVTSAALCTCYHPSRILHSTIRCLKSQKHNKSQLPDSCAVSS